jgi:hypothetical protein
MQTKMLPKILNYYCAIFFFLFVASCREKAECPSCIKCKENLGYGTSPLFITKNTKVTTTKDTMILVDEQFEQNKIKIEKKFGEQWDFCRCVLANDSLDRLIKSNTALDDKFMAYFENVDQKCKAFLVMSPNKTPDERANHENKIKKCLKAAGKK